MTTRAERVARNEIIFRAGNEAMARTAPESRTRIPFICECGDHACLAAVETDRQTYEAVRAHARRFLVAPGHESSVGEACEVIAREESYSVVEKRDEAGRIAEDTDPRGADAARSS